MTSKNCICKTIKVGPHGMACGNQNEKTEGNCKSRAWSQIENFRFVVRHQNKIPWNDIGIFIFEKPQKSLTCNCMW